MRAVPRYSEEIWKRSFISTARGLPFTLIRHENWIVPKYLYRHFFVLRQYLNKFDDIVHEMLLIKELASSLNVLPDSIQAPNYLGDVAFAILKYVNLERNFWRFTVLRCHRKVVLYYR